MALCNVTGTVYLPNGQLARSRTIVFRRVNQKVTAEYLGTVLPDDVIAKTSTSGQIAVALLTGYYSVHAEGGYIGRAVVPDSGSADMSDILDASVIPETPPVWYLQALEARDEAVDAAESVAGVQDDIDRAVADSGAAFAIALAADAKATEAQAAAQAATQMDLCLTTNFLAGLGSWTNSFPTRATMSLVGSDMVLTKIGSSVAFFEDAPVLRGGFGGRNMQMTVDVTRTSSVTSTMVVWIGVVTGPTADGVGATETGTIFRISAPLGVRVKRTVNLSVPLDRPYGRVRIKLVSGQTGDVLTVHSVSVQDSRVSAPYIDVKRGRVDMSALIESPSDPADRVTAGEANGALIEAGLSESISTGRTVVIPRGSYPTDQIIMPGAGGWSLEMEDGAVLRPASANYGGFFRQSNYGTEGAFMRNVKIYGLHIDPFTEIVDGVETPFAGNGFVGRIEDIPELYDFRFVYSRDQAMLIALVNSQLDGLYFYTEDTGGGTGGLRWNCGFESVIRSVRGQSGDDALMMYGDGIYNGASPHASEYVGQTLGMTRCGIVDAAVGCARARMLIIATTGVTAGDIDSLEEGGDVIDCFARGISSVGKDFLSTVVVTSSSERVVRGLDLQVQTKTEYSIAEYGPKSDWRRPPYVLTLNGHIKGVTADLRVETPEAAYAAIINDVARSGGGTYAPDNVRLRLSGVMGDFVANTYGANYVETGGYSDTKSGLVRIHAATNCVVDLSGIDGGDNRHGVVATQTRNLKVIGNAALNTSVDATSRYVVYAPDAVADVDDNVMHGVGRFVSSWLPDPTTPQKREPFR